MAFIPTPGGVRVVLTHQMGLLSWNNILHTETSPGIDAEGLQFIANQFYDAWALSIVPQLATAVSLVSATAYSLDSVSAPIGVYVPGTIIVGEVSGDPLPPQAAVVVTLRTANRGRSGRGRIYLSGFSEADSIGAQVAVARVSAIETGITAFRAALAAQLIPLSVLSQFTGNAPRAAGLLQTVTAHDVRNGTFGSQRRRNRRA